MADATTVMSLLMEVRHACKEAVQSAMVGDTDRVIEIQRRVFRAMEDLETAIWTWVAHIEDQAVK